MKRALSPKSLAMQSQRVFFLLAVLAASVLPASADFVFAYEGVYLMYRSIDNNTCQVVGYVEKPEAVVIPDRVKDRTKSYTVTTIGDYAFSECTSLKSVVIPESVTSIGWNAFSECASLKSVVIPNSVTSIGRNAFSKCSSLDSWIIPESISSIECGLFYGCDGLSTLTIPESVSSIGADVFCECKNLTSVTISESVTTIGEGAFWGCTSLTSVTLPNSIKSIGNLVFYGCDSLKDVIYDTSEPISGNSKVFSDATYKLATLYVREAGIEAAKGVMPWRWFENIEPIKPGGVDAVEVDGPTVVVDGGDIVVTDSSAVEVFNLHGVCVARMMAGGRVTGLPKGMYVVRAGGKTVKVGL